MIEHFSRKEVLTRKRISSTSFSNINSFNQVLMQKHFCMYLGSNLSFLNHQQTTSGKLNKSKAMLHRLHLQFTNHVLGLVLEYSHNKRKESLENGPYFLYVCLRILTEKKHPKIKLQRLRKIQISTSGSLVHQINFF